MYSSLYLVTPCLLVERFANQKKRPRRSEDLRGLVASKAKLPVRAPSSALHVGQNLAVRAADVEQAVRRVLDLERRVVDPETLVQDSLELASDAVTILAPADEHVRRESGKTRADLPDVQVVDVGDAAVRAQDRRDLVGSNALGRRLEQHMSAAADERPARPEHRAGDGERGNRIGLLEARRPDDGAGDRGAGEGV